MWWSSIHRRHHKHCDAEGDPHSPARGGFVYAWFGWMADRDNFRTRVEYLRDWEAEAPVLLLLDLFAGDISAALGGRLRGPARSAAARWFRLHHRDFGSPQLSAGDVAGRLGALAEQCAADGGTLAVGASLLFNACAHRRGAAPSQGQKAMAGGPESGESNARGGSCLAVDLRSRAFAYLSGGEAHHARHHRYPHLAQNAPPARWREDWVFA